MSEFTLEARSPLDAVRRDYSNITIEEITDRALVSIASPLDGISALNNALQSAYGTELPAVGTFVTATVNNSSVLGLSEDQFFIMFDDLGNNPEAVIRSHLEQAAYIVDQSDGWVMVRVSGDNCRAALGRICPIDLHPEKFGPGNVARTIMEHLSAIIVCEAVNNYVLLSPRSTAASFLHAIETSARNVA